MELNFDKPKKSRCVHCLKPKAVHKANTLNCPQGMKHRVIGYTRFHPTQTFEEK